MEDGEILLFEDDNLAGGTRYSDGGSSARGLPKKKSFLFIV